MGRKHPDRDSRAHWKNAPDWSRDRRGPFVRVGQPPCPGAKNALQRLVHVDVSSQVVRPVLPAWFAEAIRRGSLALTDGPI